MKKPVSTKKAPAAIGPYSQAIISGQLLFTSGQLGMNADGVLAPGLAGQTTQALQNLQAIIEQAGATMDQVLKCTVFLTNMADFAEVNEIYGQFFGEPCPARSCVAVAGLPKGALVEIEAIVAL